MYKSVSYEKYSLQIVVSFRHIKISQSKTYKNTVEMHESMAQRDNQCRVENQRNRLCYMLAEERRTWNLFRVILMAPSSRVTRSSRFSKAA